MPETTISRTSTSEKNMFGLVFFKIMLRNSYIGCEKCCDYPKRISTWLSRLNKVYRSLVGDKDTDITIDKALLMSIRTVYAELIGCCGADTMYLKTCDEILDIEPAPILIIEAGFSAIMFGVSTTPENTPDDGDTKEEK